MMLELAKATLYRSGAFGWQAVEVHDLQIEEKPYAQYPKALHVSFRAPRKRKRDGFVDTKHQTVVIEGWGIPAFIPDPCAHSESNGMGVSSTRYACFDPAYTIEFRAALAAYLETSKAVVHDFK